MKEIFNRYIETSFDGSAQSLFKFSQFAYNYQSILPPPGLCVYTLDIGIGRGEMLSCMKAWGYDYLGIDISPSTVAYCAGLDLNCEQIEDTVSWLENHRNQYAVITLLDVLEHVPREQTIEFLSAVKEALNPDGIVIIQVPNLQSPFGYLHHFNDITHVVGFVEHSLGQVLIAAGLTNHRFCGFEELVSPGIKTRIKKILRTFLHRSVRFLRAINSNPNPHVLHPVMYAVARKSP